MSPTAGASAPPSAATWPAPLVRRLAPVVVAAFGALLLLNLVAIAADPWQFPLGRQRATIAFEGGPWTWLSVGLLLATAWLTYVTTRDRTDRRWWTAVAAGFVYLAIDEGFMVHERFDDLAGTDGIDAWGWAIPGAVAVIVIGSLFGRGLLRLERTTRTRLVVAGAVFLAGAMGVEILAGLRQNSVGHDRVFFLITTVEEVLEVLGPMLVIRALLRLDRSPAA